MIKLFGIGLASAVLLDALIVRSVLVPVADARWSARPNWWLPRWLDRLLPRLNVEGGAEDTPPAEHVRGPVPRVAPDSSG